MKFFLILCLVTIAGLMFAQDELEVASEDQADDSTPENEPEDPPISEAFKRFVTTLVRNYKSYPNNTEDLNIKPVALCFLDNPRELSVIMEFRSGVDRSAQLIIIRDQGIIPNPRHPNLTSNMFETEVYSVNEDWLRTSGNDIVTAAEDSLTIEDITSENCTNDFYLRLSESLMFIALRDRCPENQKLFKFLTCNYLVVVRAELRYDFRVVERNELPAEFRPETDPCLHV